MTTTDTSHQIPVRLDFEEHAAAFSAAMSKLDQAATKELDRVGLDARLRELVRIRASQLNGCAYCIDMHTKDARAVGETEQRIYALSAWSETPYFSAGERAALAFTESVTLLADSHVPTEAYEEVAAVFHAGRGRRTPQPHRHHQRLERDRGQHPSVGPRFVQAVATGPDLTRI